MYIGNSQTNLKMRLLTSFSMTWNKLHLPSKEPYILPKEPYFLPKDTYIVPKKTQIYQKNPDFYQKLPKDTHIVSQKT